MFLILDEMSASLTSSRLNGGGAEDSSSGMGGMLVLFGDVGGDSELRRVLIEDDLECLLVVVGEDDFVENEKAGEGAVNEEEGVLYNDEGELDGLEEPEELESVDNRRRTLVC